MTPAGAWILPSHPERTPGAAQLHRRRAEPSSCPAHATAGGSLGCPSGPGQAKEQPNLIPCRRHGAVCQHGAASVPCSTDPLRAVPLQVVLQQRCAFFPSLERLETLIGRYNKPENKLALPWGRPFYLVPFNGADNVLSSFCLHSLPFPFRREIFLVLVLLSPAGAMLKALHVPALSPLAFPLLPGLGGGLS